MLIDLEKNKTIACDFLAQAFGADKSGASQYLSDDFQWWVLGDPDKLKASGTKNRQQTERTFTRLHKVLPQGMVHEIKGITAEGNRVALEIEAQGPWHDGRIYHNHYHFLFEIVDQKIVAIREYLDTLHVYELQNG